MASTGHPVRQTRPDLPWRRRPQGHHHLPQTVRRHALAAPDVLTQFNAVFRRLNEAAETNLEAESSEPLAQAVTTCRRILKAVVDVIQPVEEASRTGDGHSLSDAAYKNRLVEFLKATAPQSQRHQKALSSAGRSLWERFDATDALASKGVHASIARDEAELCALNTYLLAGELLRYNLRGD